MLTVEHARNINTTCDMSQSDSSCFGEHAYTMNLNSTKSMTGHPWCCRSCENYFFHSFMKYGIVPPTINHLTDDENIDSKLNFTFNKAQKREMNVVMSNTLVLDTMLVY
jgi:3-oxoacyl-[acyl-carrier-protein] synthase II